MTAEEETTKQCPRCLKQYTGYPAVSRKDNTTLVCSDCGREEAIIEASKHLVLVNKESEEKEVIKAVTDYVYRRHSDLTIWNIQGFNDDEKEHLQTDKEGYLQFTVEDVKIEENEIEDDCITYYVSTTIYFLTDNDPFISDAEIYQCYRCGKDWCIQWYAS